MDIGGTDVKLVAAYGKRLLRCVEYDWNPAAATDADGIVEPLCALASLLLAQANLVLAGRESALADAPREASAQALYALADEQTALLQSVRPFDGIGLCFPDVVVHNAIIGGETAKTKGIRENLKLDYEKEFAKIRALHARLAAFVVPGGPVADCNDGNMAAFTAHPGIAAGGLQLHHRSGQRHSGKL